jgi:HEAT repeat protein
MKKQQLIFCKKAFFLLFVLLFTASHMDALPKEPAVTYSVQIRASFHKKLDIDKLKSLYHLQTPVREEFVGGYYKYTVGRFITLKEAFRYRKILSEKNHVAGAFVVSYVNHKRSKALLLLPGDPPPVYRVQIAASYKKKLDTLWLKHHLGMNYPIRQSYVYPYYRYTVGDCKTLMEAVQLLRKVNNQSSFKGVAVAFWQGNPCSVRVQRWQGEAGTQKIQTAVINQNVVQHKPVKKGGSKQMEAGAKSAKTPDTLVKKKIPASRSLKILKDNALEQGLEAVEIRFHDFLNWFNQREDINTSKRFADTILFLLLYFILNFVFVLLVILVHRSFMQIRSRTTKHLQDSFSEYITRFLFDEEKEKPLNQLKKVKRRYHRQILIDEILRLHSNLSGEVSNELNRLYYQLGLDRVSMKKLGNRKWDIRARGLLELQQLEIREAAPRVFSLLNAPKEALRVEAHFAYIKLSDKDVFSFLNNIRHPLTKWEQLNIYAIVKERNIELPDFSAWFVSTQPTVVMFSVKMASLFEQMDTAPAMMKLLDHQNPLIRGEAIEGLGELFYVSASDKLKAIFESETYPNRMAILNSMALMQSENNIAFLKTLFVEQTDFNTRLFSAKALVKHGKSGIDTLYALYDELDSEGQAIYKHVLDKRI